MRLASEGRKIDLIACDSNVNPNLSARLALSLLPQQSARAVLVLSLKNFVGRRKRWEREIAEIAELVEGSGYERGYASCTYSITLPWRRPWWRQGWSLANVVEITKRTKTGGCSADGSSSCNKEEGEVVSPIRSPPATI